MLAASARVTTPPREGRAEGELLHAPRSSLRILLLAPPVSPPREGGSVGKEVPGPDSVTASLHGHVTAKEHSGREAGSESETPEKKRELEVGCTQLDGARLQEDGYMSLDEASPVPPLPASMPTTPPPRPRPTESVHSPAPEKKAKPLVPFFGALAPPPMHARQVQRYKRKHLLGKEWNYRALSPRPWPRVDLQHAPVFGGTAPQAGHQSRTGRTEERRPQEQCSSA